MAKICTVREETDETVFWLAFMGEAGLFPVASRREAERLQDEAQQLARIFAATYRTARRKLIKHRRALKGRDTGSAPAL